MPRLLSYAVERIKPYKREAIWGMFEPNILAPLCYLQKPKHVSQEDWQIIIKAIRLELNM